MEPDGLQTFIDDVGRVLSSTDDEHELTKRVAKRLSELRAGGYRLELEVTRPSPVRNGLRADDGTRTHDLLHGKQML
jgi:3-mercaptopropionate dioxygenase